MFVLVPSVALTPEHQTKSLRAHMAGREEGLVINTTDRGCS